MKLSLKILLFSLMFCISWFGFIQNSFAQAPLVTCGLTSNYTDRCTLCDLIKGINRIIKWGTGVLVVAALVAIVAGGIMYIISAGNSGMMESAKTVIKQALWGVVIVLGAWVIVNTILWMITSKLYPGTGEEGNKFMDISNWYNFDCKPASSGGGGGGGETPTTCTYTYSEWGACTNGTQTRTVTSTTPAGCEGTPPATSQSCSPPGAFNCAGGSCSQIDGAIANNKFGVDPNILKAITVGGESCNPAVGTADNKYSCGYGQVTAKNRAWCGITGTAQETCAKVQADIDLDINCAAKLIKEGNRRCSSTDILIVASCYNAGQPGRCAVTTDNYCDRVSEYYNNCK